MRLFVSLFLLLFLVDGSVSLLDDLLSLIAPVSFLSGFRSTLANVVVLQAVAVYCCLGIDRRLPKRVFLPLIAYVALVPFATLVAPAVTGNHLFGLIMSAIQVALAGVPLLVFKNDDKRSYIPPAELFEGPLFSLRQSLWFGAANLVVLPLFLGLVALSLVDALAMEYTAGFMRVGLNGISMAERTYQRDNRTIRLAGMIHIGDKHYYRDLMQSRDHGRTIVLAEGVSDKRQLLRNRPHYGHLANYLGLSSQQDTLQLQGRTIDEQQFEAGPTGARHAEQQPSTQTADILRADLDLSSFQPATIQFLDTMGSYLNGKQPALEGIVAFNRWAEEHVTPQMQQELMDDILRRRNREVIRHLDKALDRYDTVVIPWGALHMKEVEEEVLKRGFTLKDETRRQSISFLKVLAAIR